ncbi:Radial spokehead-like protein [Spironucleus salmonicida]|uniref:Radial spokehead-like protein n=1 Tax=Spironucleus salmonicida TaxID=348837 RepID=V6LSA4_9EUKA|nr:Radial spokehead-like protein [Spironucleus salmonicida]|eukprot:EST47460.1 Radial spokehead-like protein [Spironucleus salmonicida]
MDKRISDFLDYLQIKNEYGQTLYGHLAQIIAKLLDDKPANAVGAMTPISLEIKKAAGASESENQYESQLTQEEYELVEHILSLYQRKNQSINKQKTLPMQQENNTRTITTNVIQLNEQLKLVGSGFDDLTAQLIQKRLDTFVIERKGFFSEVKFFGKFDCKKGDYWVLECLPAKNRKKMYRFNGQALQFDEFSTPNNCKNLQAFIPEKRIHFLTEKKVKKMQEYLAGIIDKIDPDQLNFDLTTTTPPPKITVQSIYPAGDNVHYQGVNKFIYFVTKDLTIENTTWIRLPDIEARQLRVSRFVKARLSGDLTIRPWDKIPPFPGCEAHFLRCLIARIKHGATLAPAPCLAMPEDPEVEEEELDDKQQEIEKKKRFMDPNIVNNCFKDDIEVDEMEQKRLNKHLLMWPAINKEIDAIEYEELLSLDNWVHTCPILSHRGIVLPFELPEDAEPEEEPEEEPEAEEEEVQKEEDEVIEEQHEGEEEKGEEDEEAQPIDIGPSAKERLDALYKEADQKRILDENAIAVKEITKTKVKFIAPAPHWQLVRDPWDAPIKENKGIYIMDRFFGLEINPVDIQCRQQELPEKEQLYWDKQQEVEDKLKEQDETLNEGDFYDEEKELPQGDRPEQMAAASGDSEIIIHTNKKQEINIASELPKVPPYKVITNKLLYKNSPVAIASQRWNGLLNIVYNHSNQDVIAFASVYIGDGQQTNQINSFDQMRFCLPPPMCIPPNDLLEEPDLIHELEKEVQEREGDMEQKDRDKIANIKAERAEKKRLRIEDKKAKEEAARLALEEKHEGEEEEKQEAEVAPTE